MSYSILPIVTIRGVGPIVGPIVKNFFVYYAEFMMHYIRIMAKVKASSSLAEVRAYNQQLAHTAMLPPDTSIKPQLQPSVKYIQGPAGNIGLRIFKPSTIRAEVMDIHGGGWCAGIAAFDDIWNDEMARICKVAVVSVDYRLGGS
jgi:acetyl esterase/lipase